MLHFIVLCCILLFLIFLVGVAESATHKPRMAGLPVKLKKRGLYTRSDDKSRREPQDRNRISLSEGYEVRYWSEKFGVTPEELRDAVQKVGNSAAAVEQELKAA